MSEHIDEEARPTFREYLEAFARTRCIRARMEDNQWMVEAMESARLAAKTHCPIENVMPGWLRELCVDALDHMVSGSTEDGTYGLKVGFAIQTEFLGEGGLSLWLSHAPEAHSIWARKAWRNNSDDGRNDNDDLSEGMSMQAYDVIEALVEGIEDAVGSWEHPRHRGPKHGEAP